MKERNFTPEQSKMILNAVNGTASWYGNTYVLTKNLHNLCTQYIQSNIEEEEIAQETEETVLHLTPLHVSDILYYFRQLFKEERFTYNSMLL
jgi:hypothetical protein